jgi:RNA polymerase sigma-70 factor, ECF subfamily
MPVGEQAIPSEAAPMADALEMEVEVAVREYAGLVYKIAYSVVRHRDDAEDAAQETFLRFLNARRRRQLEAVRDWRAYLAQAAWRVAIDRSRARKRRQETSLDDLAEAVNRWRAAGAGTDEIAATREMAELLERLIAALPREQREVVMLSMVEELSSREVAAILRIPEGSVRTRLFRARQTLKSKLSAVVENRHGR